MKRYLHWITLAVGILWLAGDWRRPAVPKGQPDLTDLGNIPVLAGGRSKPLDTVARNSLLIIHGKQRVKSVEGKSVPALRWLADTLFDPATADTYPAFVIHHPEVLGLFGWQQADKKYFSFRDLTPFLGQIEQQAQRAEQAESRQRSTFQSAIVNLRNSLLLYHRLKNTIELENREFAKSFGGYSSFVAATGKMKDSAGAADKAGRTKFLKLLEAQSQTAYFASIPPSPGTGEKSGEWVSTGESLLQGVSLGTVNPVVTLYAQMGDAYRNHDTALFKERSQQLRQLLNSDIPRSAHRAAYEFTFNQLQPFYRSMGLYVLAFFLACGSWLGWGRPLTRSAFWLLVLALAVHTYGLASRMYLQERPPITNLYSSAVFIGWLAVVIGLYLERIFKNGMGAACSGIIGFLTLVIAHHLAGSGDTLEMLQAVLDTNLWLAAHVIVITAGYSAMFLAGMIAFFYVVRGFFTTSLSATDAKALVRMTYGIICFATLFSFLGTVLGGIWADQSWGRFWGWDPKENGALLIVLWCALILHARWAGYIRDRGLMAMALFGNVITAFSWFGVNMIGVGLHSYGFMEKAFPWLIAFMASQLIFIAITFVPRERWRSALV